MLRSRPMNREQEMTAAFVPRRLVRTIARCLGVPPALVTAEARLCEDLGADDLEITRLALALETDFEIDVSDAEMAKVVTVNDVARLLRPGASRSLP